MGVNIRKKRGKLYLDIYSGGKRTWEALHLTLSRDKEQNKEVLRHAEVCRSLREMQLLTGAWNLQDPVAAKKRLVTYLEEYAKKHTSPTAIQCCLYHLKNFPGGAAILLSQAPARGNSRPAGDYDCAVRTISFFSPRSCLDKGTTRGLWLPPERG